MAADARARKSEGSSDSAPSDEVGRGFHEGGHPFGCGFGCGKAYLLQTMSPVENRSHPGIRSDNQVVIGLEQKAAGGPYVGWLPPEGHKEKSKRISC